MVVTPPELEVVGDPMEMADADADPPTAMRPRTAPQAITVMRMRTLRARTTLERFKRRPVRGVILEPCMGFTQESTLSARRRGGGEER